MRLQNHHEFILGRAGARTRSRQLTRPRKFTGGRDGWTSTGGSANRSTRSQHIPAPAHTLHRPQRDQADRARHRRAPGRAYGGRRDKSHSQDTLEIRMALHPPRARRHSEARASASAPRYASSGTRRRGTYLPFSSAKARRASCGRGLAPASGSRHRQARPARCTLRGRFGRGRGPRLG